MSNTNVLEPVPAEDWNAAPPSMQALLQKLLPLVDEVAELRERVALLENSHSLVSVEDKHTFAETQAQRERLGRYHALVNKSFVPGVNGEEAAEMKSLGQAIDAYNAEFYAPVLKVMRAIDAQK